MTLRTPTLLNISICVAALALLSVGCGQSTNTANGNNGSSPTTNKAVSPPASPTVAVTQPVGGEDKPCSEEAHLKSPQSTTKAEFNFQNNSKIKVTLWWIDWDGQRKRFNDVPPGKPMKMFSYVGHWWVVADEDGTCLKIVSAPYDLTMTK